MNVARWQPTVIVGVLGVCWFAVVVAWWFAPVFALVLAVVLGLGTAALLAYVVRVAVCPVVDLASRAEQIAAGDEHTMSAPCEGIPEVDALRRSLDAMAGHVRRAQNQGHAHAAAISTAQENERERLAHELHDTTVQSLIAVAQRLDRAGRTIDADPERARSIVGDARQDVTVAISGLRDIIADLRPPALDELGLLSALELVIARLPASPAVRLHTEGVVRRLDPERELAALRIVQEALSNVRRHADATSADVGVRFTPDALHLSIADDGRGFAAQSVPEDGHWGLVGMSERATRFGGTVAVDSAPGRGARIDVVLPDHPSAQPSTEMVDPVCHARIQPEAAFGSATYEGREYFFCCPVCQGAFQRDPARYATATSE